MKIDLQTKELLQKLNQFEENNTDFQETLVELFNRNETVKTMEEERMNSLGIGFLTGKLNSKHFLNNGCIRKLCCFLLIKSISEGFRTEPNERNPDMARTYPKRFYNRYCSTTCFF